VVYENQWNQKALMLNGTDANLNVFYLSGALLGQIGGVEADYSDGGGTFNFNVPIGSSVIINVDGVDVDFGHPGNFGFVCNGQDCAANAATNILFNFYQATTLQTQTVFGSILAPLADITFTNGYIAGSVIANSIGGPAYTTGEFHSELFAGRTSVPAPSAALVLILGLALCAASRKRVTLN
jgi:choice-of-anchor A domain-containing protein